MAGERRLIEDISFTACAASGALAQTDDEKMLRHDGDEFGRGLMRAIELKMPALMLCLL